MQIQCHLPDSRMLRRHCTLAYQKWSFLASFWRSGALPLEFVGVESHFSWIWEREEDRRVINLLQLLLLSLLVIASCWNRFMLLVMLQVELFMLVIASCWNRFMLLVITLVCLSLPVWLQVALPFIHVVHMFKWINIMLWLIISLLLFEVIHIPTPNDRDNWGLVPNRKP